MGKHNVSRIQIIPAPMFYRIWHSVSKFDLKDEYIRNFTSVFSKDYIDTNKLNLKPDTFLRVLIICWDLYHINIANIINVSGLSRAQFGFKYCIPIRTLEEWCKNDTSPDYLRLFLLKDLGLFLLPKYVHIK